MSAAKRIPATKKVKEKEEVNKKALYWTIGVAIVAIAVLSTLIIIFS